MVNVATLVDGNPENNFLKKDIVFNPDGKLSGATYCFVVNWRACLLHHLHFRGFWKSWTSSRSPSKPKIVGELTRASENPRCVGRFNSATRS